MAYVSTAYAQNPSAPLGSWTCAPTSELGPFSEPPKGAETGNGDYCGQCVSYVKKVKPDLPATGAWRKGVLVKGNTNIMAGTVIATFNASGRYYGHAAIYVDQNKQGIVVYDQYVTGRLPKPAGQRLLKWGGRGNSNNGDNFYVVE